LVTEVLGEFKNKKERSDSRQNTGTIKNSETAGEHVDTVRTDSYLIFVNAHAFYNFIVIFWGKIT
jgi:hypothetical protein